MSFSSVHHLADDRADNIHFLCGEPIASRKITWGASRSYVAFNMRKVVINPVKPARSFNGSAIHAWLHYQIENFCRSQITGVHSLVGFAKKHRPAFICLAVFFIACFCAVLLRWGHINPPFFSTVATFFAGIMTLLALVRQAKGPRPLTMKIVRSRSK